MSHIESLIIQPPNEAIVMTTSMQNLNLKIKCTVPDPINPGTIHSIETSMRFPVNKPLTKVIDEFKQFNKEFRPYDLFVKYKKKIFINGNLADLGITNKETIELVSYSTEKDAANNQGFSFIFWATPILAIGASFIIAGLSGDFNVMVRGTYVLIGSILFIPTLVLIIIGGSLLFSKQLHIGFVGQEWFGTCCCSCCQEQEEIPELEQEEEPQQDETWLF